MNIELFLVVLLLIGNGKHYAVNLVIGKVGVKEDSHVEPID